MRDSHSSVTGQPGGRRHREVGPVIGGELAEGLLRHHEPDVLAPDRCGSCGLPFPCPTRVFAASFFADSPGEQPQEEPGSLDVPAPIAVTG